MSFFDKLKNFLLGKIKDEEIITTEWIYCPKCKMNYEKAIIIDNHGKCPKCKEQLIVLDDTSNFENLQTY